MKAILNNVFLAFIIITHTPLMLIFVVINLIDYGRKRLVELWNQSYNWVQNRTQKRPYSRTEEIRNGNT
jgi:hypothetical protein